MTRYSDDVSTLPIARVVSGLRWRADEMRNRLRDMRTDGISDHLRCRLELGFALPPLDTMQNYRRLKFLHDCIQELAPPTGVALEIGCFKCSSTVFIAHAAARARLAHVYAIDLFTGTPSWNGSVDYLDVAQDKLTRYGLNERVTLIRHDSFSYPWHEPIAALHIDADHAYEAVWKDIQKYAPFIVENGICVFDDYDVSHPGVTRAVHRLLNEDPSFEVAGANYQGVEFGSVCLRRVRQPG
jgi:predicted O-methyltransferase YrrM